MAKLSVAAFDSINQGITLAQPDVLVTLDFSAGAVESNVLNAGNVRYVRLCADAPCYYETGSSPTVTADSRYLPANTVELIGVLNGNRIRVAAGAE